MIDILHRKSGRVVLQVDADTLERANLSGEYLIHADLQGANLRRAMLLFANLSGADLSGACLRSADLRGANLTEVDLSGADLADVNLSGATLSLTVLAGCRNLHEARGLEAVLHAGPSEIDHETLRESLPHLPDSFMRGAGYTRSEIRLLRSLYPGRDPA